MVKKILSFFTIFTVVFFITLNAVQAILSAPENFQAIASPQVQVKLNWSHQNTENVQEFRIYRTSLPAEVGLQLATCNNSVFSYIDQSVVTPNSYYYYIRAVDDLDVEGISSNVVGAPYVKLDSRYHSIEIPLNYSGDDSNVVPGGKINYTSVLVNEGFSPAISTVISDWVPGNTTFYQNSATSNKNASISFQHLPGGGYDDDQDEVIRIKWVLDQDLTPFEFGMVTFSVVID
jgi:uncharacterized repeat protein (TIGR01451 family)